MNVGVKLQRRGYWHLPDSLGWGYSSQRCKSPFLVWLLFQGIMTRKLSFCRNLNFF